MENQDEAIVPITALGKGGRMRITLKDLEAVVHRINRITGNPEEPYKKIDGKFVPQAGCYHLDGAYGGWELIQMCDEGSAIRDVFSGGHVPKRELYEKMQAFLKGYQSRKKVTA